MNRISIGRRPAVAMAVALVVSLFLFAGTARAATHQVPISGFAFVPATLTVAVGDTVTWTNQDTAPHTVTATSGGTFDSGNLANGGTFSQTFASAGTFAYRCEIHPSMIGSVVVQAAAASTPAPPATGAGAASSGETTGIQGFLLAGSLLAAAGGTALVVSRRLR